HAGIIADLSTLQRHLEAHHRGSYLDWCSKNKFISKLLKDCAEAKRQASAQSQEHITAHLVLNPDAPITYSESGFLEASLHWLPIQAFDHLAFQNMIKMAARAMNGVKLPNCNSTRSGLISIFMKEMSSLRDRLSV
ncbi:hypothetical protein BDN71DRAFT_1352340, partial [Pleurotus eryngii]